MTGGRRVRAWAVIGAAVVLGIGLAWRFGNDLQRLQEPALPSASVGTRSSGHLRNGHRLPTEGWNFTTYSYLGSTIGRTAVHDRVRDALVDAWSELAETHPDVVWQYGETAWPHGGDFFPHKTHQHGLSVDHMVPVRTPDGGAARLPCRAWNALCYRLHADRSGDFGGLQTDFEGLAALVDAVDRHAAAHDLRLDLVIYAPDLQDDLARATGGDVVRRVRFSTNPSWVRHDNHVHFDFSVR